ncbi:hypothetical protein AGMMS50262_03000 [Bacteroidia bacterium]|nr:hypothetical protein AGMMS50262_03000 [Bacteroidia bacterium]
MKQSTLTILSVIFIIAIAFFQGYILYNMYNLQKKSLAKELDVVLDNAYKEDLNQRISQIKENQDIPIEIFKETDGINDDGAKDTIVYYNFDTNENTTNNDIVGAINSAVIQYANLIRPVDLNNLDSLVSIGLQERKIVSNFFVWIVDKDGVRQEQSKPDNDKKLEFPVYSQKIPLDLEKTKFLELVLVNPQGTIFERLLIIIVLCVLFSFIAIYTVQTLGNLYAKQRKLAALKNDFFGQVSHELKRPLTQAHMAVSSLVERMKHNDGSFDASRYLDIAQRSTEDMTKKINMILALSREEDGVLQLNIKEFDLPATLALMVERIEMLATKPTQITVDNQLKSPAIRADIDHFMQSVANLIENAIKYSNDSVEIQIRLSSENNRLILAVKDNGVGIAEENLSRIFQKYDRLNPANSKVTGFGIGLNYVKKIIEKHGGKIDVTSLLGKGSEFTISLPRQ